MKYLVALLLFLNLSLEANTIEVVAQVDNWVITSREIEIDRIVQTHLMREKAVGSSGEYFNHVIREWTVFSEARAFGVSQVSNREVHRQEARFLKSLNSSSVKSKWRKLDVKKGELRQIIRRKIQARNFIKFKKEASLVPATDAEALNFFQRNRKEFVGKTFSSVKDKIKEKLSQDRARERLREWFVVLERKYNVRRILN